MGMSTYVQGIKPPDKRWSEMKAVWDSCVAAGVQIPKAVEDFFDGTEPDEKGVVVELDTPCAVKYNVDGRSGIEVLVDKLPKGVKIVRFVNSW